mmetsp:Transcript_37388/g.33049  ORF Transcript_37388/g.33049 Transcript_37388/m.33049 type:complete len:163 (+) Transcript_37388:68-556(+)
MNALRAKGLYRPINRSLNHQFQQTRRVSKIVWDSFGFRKDGTDIKKRASCALWLYHGWGKYWRFVWGAMLLGPCHFLFYQHGVFDYIFRRRTIAPLAVNYEAQFPWRPPDGYENPLFEPAKKWQAIREKKRKEIEEMGNNRPGYFSEPWIRPKRHKYRTGGR